jgi:hypothetical protein
MVSPGLFIHRITSNNSIDKNMTVFYYDFAEFAETHAR